MSDIEWFILDFFAYGPKPIDSAAELAAREPGHYFSPQECRQAICSCIAKGVLQIIDAGTRARLKDNIIVNELNGPLYNFPCCGDVDYTVKGVSLAFDQTEASVPFLVPEARQTQRTIASRPVSNQDVTVVSMPHPAKQLVEEAGPPNSSYKVRGPIPLGSWRGFWWEDYAEGYCVVTELDEPEVINVNDYPAEREIIAPIAAKLRDPFDQEESGFFEPERQIDVLRGFGIGSEEWTIMQVVGSTCSHDKRHVARVACRIKDDGTEKETAERDQWLAVFQQAVASCVNKKWLVEVDHKMVRIIQKSLQKRPMLGPFRQMPVIGQDIDFTLNGVELFRQVHQRLYGRIGSYHCWRARSEGPGCRICVYRKDQHYFADLESAIKEAGSIRHRSGIIGVSKPIPIGGWCVYWWKGFRNGYRIDSIVRNHMELVKCLGF
jgi:hypothetical protein